jgi:hypothetical protein
METTDLVMSSITINRTSKMRYAADRILLEAPRSEMLMLYMWVEFTTPVQWQRRLLQECRQANCYFSDRISRLDGLDSRALRPLK